MVVVLLGLEVAKVELMQRMEGVKIKAILTMLTLRRIRSCRPGEIQKLIDGGVHPHDLKDNSRQDLFKDGDGNISVKPKAGNGPGDPTGLNINDF